MAFDTLDLGRVIATAEGIKGLRQRSVMDRLQEQYLGQRIQAGEQEMQDQAHSRQIILGKEKAQQIDVKAAQILQQQNTKNYVEQNEPDLVKQLTANGVDWATESDNSIKQRVQMMQSHARQELGVAPAIQQQTIQGEGGSILQRDPTTGALKQIVAPQKPDHFTETEAGKNQRASEANALKQRIADAKAAKDAAKAATGPKTTEGEKSAANYLSRMEKAETLLDSGYVPTPKDFLAANRLMTTESGLMSSLANKWISPEGQKYYQAASDWARAKLRKESGASISPSEIQQEIKTYFPVPGDSDDVIEQKRLARQTATEGMRTMAAGAAAPASGGTLGVGQSTKVGGFTVTRKK